MLEQPPPVRPGFELPVLGGGDAGADEVLELADGVECRNDAEAGAGERAGAVYYLVQDGIEVEAVADAQNGRAQAGDAVVRRLVVLLTAVGALY